MQRISATLSLFPPLFQMSSNDPPSIIDGIMNILKVIINASLRYIQCLHKESLAHLHSFRNLTTRPVLANIEKVSERKWSLRAFGFGAFACSANPLHICRIEPILFVVRQCPKRFVNTAPLRLANIELALEVARNGTCGWLNASFNFFGTVDSDVRCAHLTESFPQIGLPQISVATTVAIGIVTHFKWAESKAR